MASHSRRVTAALTGVLFIQLTALGSLPLCAMRAGATPAPATVHHHADVPSDNGCTPSGANRPCGDERGPATCLLMTSCAAPMVAAAAGAEFAPPAQPQKATPFPMAAVINPVVAPDPPPPRA